MSGLALRATETSTRRKGQSPSGSCFLLLIRSAGHALRRLGREQARMFSAESAYYVISAVRQTSFCPRFGTSRAFAKR